MLPIFVHMYSELSELSASERSSIDIAQPDICPSTYHLVAASVAAVGVPTLRSR